MTIKSVKLSDNLKLNKLLLSNIRIINMHQTNITNEFICQHLTIKIDYSYT